jgi:hypothetical protein
MRSRSAGEKVVVDPRRRPVQDRLRSVKIAHQASEMPVRESILESSPVTNWLAGWTTEGDSAGARRDAGNQLVPSALETPAACFLPTLK